MGRKGINALRKEVNALKRKAELDEPETKVSDTFSSLVGGDYITNKGIWVNPNSGAIDLTRTFVQGLLQTGGNIEGNYCKIKSMDLRLQLINENAVDTVSRVRVLMVRAPGGQQLSAADILTQVLEYGNGPTYGQKAYCSPYKMNSTIAGGYDVMMDKMCYLTSQTATYAPERAFKYIRFKKSWKKGLELRFSGTANALTLEKNRIYLIAFDVGAIDTSPVSPTQGSKISFVNRIRYVDQ